MHPAANVDLGKLAEWRSGISPEGVEVEQCEPSFILKQPVRGTETSTDLVLFVAQSWVCDVVVTYAGPGGPEWPARVEKSLADGEVLVIPSKP